MEKNWKAYIGYCSEDQKKEYNIKESEHIIPINIFEKSELYNIHHLNYYYSNLVLCYYIGKNHLKSDYVCIWDHRRYLTPIDFDKLDDNYIQVYFFMPTNLTPFEYMIHEGINEYIIYQFIKYMIEKHNIDHDKIIDCIYNKSWDDRLWLINVFNCNWKVFCDICEFTFDFINYIIPNQGFNNKESLDIFLDDMKRSLNIIRNKSKDGEIIEYGRIESDDRVIGSIYECLYPLFCELMGYKAYMNIDNKRIIIKVFDYDKNTIYNNISKCIHKNIFSGCRNYIIITNEDKKEELKEIIMSDWYKIYHGPINILSVNEYENKYKSDNDIIINLNQYVDTNTPIDTNFNIKNIE